MLVAQQNEALHPPPPQHTFSSTLRMVSFLYERTAHSVGEKTPRPSKYVQLRRLLGNSLWMRLVNISCNMYLLVKSVDCCLYGRAGVNKRTTTISSWSIFFLLSSVNFYGVKSKTSSFSHWTENSLFSIKPGYWRGGLGSHRGVSLF